MAFQILSARKRKLKIRLLQSERVVDISVKDADYTEQNVVRDGADATKMFC